MNSRNVFVALFIVSLPLTSFAQISWSGIYDFEIKKGGSGSSLGWNQLPNDNVQLSLQNFQLFVDATIHDQISLSAKIATYRQNTTDPRYFDLELAYVTFWNVFGPSLNFSVGKILTPFGAFTRRQLSPDNPLIGQPLFFFYQTNVSPMSGYLDPGSASYAQTSYGEALSTMYDGGYYVGAEAFGSLADNLFDYGIAVMNSPLASPSTSVNLNGNIAVHGRVAFHPAMWGTVGFSYCTGSFVEQSVVNHFYDAQGGIEQFKQNTAGIDLTLSYLFYEIDAEYILNSYEAPYIIYSPSGWYVSGLAPGKHLTLSNTEILVDAKIDIPFYPGLFVAGRFNTLTFGTMTDPYAASATVGQSIRWDNNVRKYAIGIGYKLVHNVLVKINYERTTIDTTPSPDLDVVAGQLSVSF
jgi:hypothetical protein